MGDGVYDFVLYLCNEIMKTVEAYTPEMEREWNDHVATSRNGTFLLDRRYMDYHADRFCDASMVARDDHGRLLALLPACREGDTVYSHRGLTYGGWVVAHRRCDALDMLEIWDAMTDRLRADGVKHLIYKPVPHIYHRAPAEEDIYAAVRSGAQLSSTLISSVIDLTDPIPMDQGSRQRARRALDSGLTFGASTDWEGFWQVLTQLLATRYGSSPVHNLDEIRLLASRFPNNIKLFTVTDEGEILAGVVVYITDTTVHSQYTAASPRGKELSVLPGLYRYIMDAFSGTEQRWFDFGTSNEDGGREVNAGLLRQKCSYGGRAVVYPTLTLDL